MFHPTAHRPDHRPGHRPGRYRLGPVLGIWAHPDDETFLSAGLMARARRAGHRVVVVSATHGEAGTDDPDRWPPHLLAPARAAELGAALARLGVTEHHLATYPDGGCADVPLDEGTAFVSRWIHRVRPSTIVTFGPDGMTGHPDHRAVAAWAAAAWEESSRRPRLLQATVTPRFHETWGELNDRVGLWGGEPPCTPVDQLALAVQLRGRELDQKVAALQEHRTQVGPLIAAAGHEAFHEWWATEAFADAATADRLATAGSLAARV